MSRRQELKRTLLRHLLLYGRATRPELVALTGIRAATVFEAIDELKSGKLIIEPERRGKKTGRRAPELCCAADCCHTVGVELRLSGCTGVIVNACGEGEIKRLRFLFKTCSATLLTGSFDNLALTVTVVTGT